MVRVGGVLMAVLLLVAACGDSDDEGEAQARDTSTTPVTTTAPADTATTAPPSPSTSVPVPTTEPPDSVDRISGVVQVSAEACGNQSRGSAFLIEPDLLATAAHVVEGSESVTLATSTGEVEAEVVGMDMATDLAILRTSSPVEGHVFDLAAEPPQQGVAVDAIGYPLGLGVSISKGTVSALTPASQVADGASGLLLQTDAAVNPGSSGGPLLTSSDGLAVGVVSAKLSDIGVEGLGFAVSTSDLLALLASWEATGASFVSGQPCPPDTTVESVAAPPTIPPPPTPPAAGSRCDPGSWTDCVGGRATHDGLWRYIPGFAECLQAFGSTYESPGLCTDLDGDGFPGYPDTGGIGVPSDLCPAAPPPAQRVSFERGSEGIVLDHDDMSTYPAALQLGISGGQQINVTTDGWGPICVYAPGGWLLGAIDEGNLISNPLPSTGDYVVVVYGEPSTISIFIPAP